LGVQRAFENYEEIDGRSTISLTYLKAVIDEGLRLYPPILIWLPRVSLGETVDGYFVLKDTIVFTSMWAAIHNEEDFY
jgi:cytochrome P450